MNKVIVIVLLIFVFTMSCTKKPGETIEIRERMFLGQVNDVYLNTRDHSGKIIKLEGIFMVEEWGGRTYRFVARYGPGGCCGNDAMVGFEVVWTESNKAYPEHNSWVEAAGVLKTEGRSMHLDLISLTVLNRRGAEFVTQ
jgi:uncharacterized membrane protein YcgQ (UPF0703/DUF1980 family)